MTEGTEWLTQMGVGGIFAWLIIREVVTPFIKHYVQNGKNGPKNAVTRQEFNEHKKTVQYKDNCEQIVKRFDGLIENQTKAFDKLDKVLERQDNKLEDIRALIETNGQA